MRMRFQLHRTTRNTCKKKVKYEYEALMERQLTCTLDAL